MAAMLLSLSLLSSAILPAAAAGAEKAGESDGLFNIEHYASYREYLAQYPDAGYASSAVKIDCSAQAEDAQKLTLENVACVRLLQEQAVEYTFSVEERGFYNIEMLYYPMEGDGTAVKLDLRLDGQNPFEGTAALTLPRKWKFSDEVRKDTQDNEIRRDSVEVTGWMRTRLENASLATGEALLFYLEPGEHTVRVGATRNAVALGEIAFVQPQQTPAYAEALAGWEKAGYTDAGESLELIQAEQATGRSEQSIAMQNDRSSASTTPYHSYKIRYNCLGGSSWKTSGEWAEWEINVPKSGLYTIAARFLQSEKSDGVSTRILTIDGELPFEEAACIAFPYGSSWQTTLLGGGTEAFKFYLAEGTHTLRMTVGLGKQAAVIDGAAEVLEKLNNIYVNIVMVTGTSPDMNRDYSIARLLPEVLADMETVSAELKQLEQQKDTVTGESKGEPAFERLYLQLDRMVNDPESVPRRLSNFRSNITSLGTWINDNRAQPLTLDYLQLLAPSAALPRAEKGFFASLKHHFLQFIGSFKMNYMEVGSIETDTDRKVTVWISSGRDQADIIRKMINSQFTPQSGIEVDLQLVSAGALLPATLAGIGPDVSLGVTEAEPVNYALRNAAADLSQLDGAQEVFSRFHEASLTAFTLDNGVYALPETMDHPMLFYRKDVLAELGIDPEDLKTWDTLLQKVLPELMLSYFDFGLTTDMKSYASLLYQYGGEFYNEEKTASALDSTEAYQAFETMTQLYTDYKIPKTFDFVNRFRSGQMPLAVTSYTAYNQLSVFAPEIEGKWGMTVLPGVVDSEGNIHNTAATTVTGSVIMKNSDNIDDAWTFLKWWSQGSVQSEYARELETALGTAARLSTANLEAMETLQWSSDIKAALREQRKSLKGVEQIAGSYYTSRYYDFAFRDVVENGGNTRESLLDSCEDITGEIVEKRREFYGKGQ